MLSSANICKSLWPNQKELSRKIVHIFTGAVAPLAWWLQIPSAMAIPIAISISIALLINHQWHFIPTFEEVSRKSYGTVTYGIAISLLLIFFWESNPAAVCAGVLVMALGDGLAGLIGKKIDSPIWIIWGQKKSVIGTLTMAITSYTVLISLNQIGAFGLHPLQILAITSLAVGLEQLSKLGLDNLTVPLGVAISWSLTIKP